jgi:hypothetical protein
MSLFIEVESVEKGCKVIVNLETILEIAPLLEGGCALFYSDASAVGGKSPMKVKDNYTHFQQLAMQMVSSEDIAKKVKSLKSVAMDMDIPKL